MEHTIYRIEHETVRSRREDKIGAGCYTTDLFPFISEMGREHTNMYGRENSHPNISQDFMHLGYDYNELQYRFCAFDSMSKLKEWFGYWLRPLLAEGFIIKEYKVSTYLMGLSEKQIMFHPKHIL